MKHYYNQKSKIEEGKSGNNLSGFYIFLRGEFDQREVYEADVNPDGSYDYNEFNRSKIAGQVGWGFQKELLNN